MLRNQNPRGSACSGIQTEIPLWGVNIRRNVSRNKPLRELSSPEIIPDSGGQYAPEYPGILNAIKTEVESGWLVSFKKLVEADVFCDFLEMSEYLLEENYKDPAAVMIGSVLEEHLRSLCVENSISIFDEGKEKQIPKKASRLNDDLAKKGVFNKLTQKSVTSWLDLRNNAAHGKYGEYNIDQVKLMYQGVFQFINK